MTQRLRRSTSAVAALLSLSFALTAHADGAKDFVARPALGAAKLELPSKLSWQTTTDTKGMFRVSLNAIVDATYVL
ncbi:MAG: hypothetical protein K8S25_17860, partial [Alphaproteobacteria bacterium]|nr:hypothetical protein [Alphaproteobacteria bacterium]